MSYIKSLGDSFTMNKNKTKNGTCIWINILILAENKYEANNGIKSEIVGSPSGSYNSYLDKPRVLHGMKGSDAWW